MKIFAQTFNLPIRIVDLDRLAYELIKKGTLKIKFDDLSILPVQVTANQITKAFARMKFLGKKEQVILPDCI